MNGLRRRHGQSAIEMAMLAPIIFMLLMGAFDFARAAYAWASLSYAVREGARLAIITGTPPTQTDDQVFGMVKQAANAAGLPVSKATCFHGQSSGTVAPAPTTLNSGYVYILGANATAANAPGGQAAAAASAGCRATVPALYGTYPLTVQVVYTFAPITPFIQQFVGASFTMTVSSTMYTEF
jgi:Flp pilus assembly protein TadG